MISLHELKHNLGTQANISEGLFLALFCAYSFPTLLSWHGWNVTERGAEDSNTQCHSIEIWYHLRNSIYQAKVKFIYQHHTINKMCCFSSTSKSGRATFKFQTADVFIGKHWEIIDWALCWVLLEGMVWLNAAMGSCVEYCVVQMRNGSVPIHFHINRTALNSIQGKFWRSIPLICKMVQNKTWMSP